MRQPSQSDTLFVVLPVYNEQAALREVLEEWLPVLRAASDKFVLYAINDGSTDASPHILTELSAEFPEIEILNQANAGHGPACVRGYATAVARNAEWIFQIDSDGQCDPRYFSRLWDRRNTAKPVYGFRSKRDDGLRRVLISRALRWFVYLGTGTWVRDANVPYRLMHVSTVARCLPLIPDKPSLANVLLSALQEHYYGIDWVNIRFRNRRSGQSSLQFSALLRTARQLYEQLCQCFSTIC